MDGSRLINAGLGADIDQPRGEIRFIHHWPRVAVMREVGEATKGLSFRVNGRYRPVSALREARKSPAM